jgi:hypothetical protein
MGKGWYDFTSVGASYVDRHLDAPEGASSFAFCAVAMQFGCDFLCDGAVCIGMLFYSFVSCSCSSVRRCKMMQNACLCSRLHLIFASKSQLVGT